MMRTTLPPMHMRCPIALLMMLVFSLTFSAPSMASKPDNWHHNKYSMFIHYGLYSRLGGVWEGKPVTSGYSEQIFSFGVHFTDWYEEVARSFAPSAWNARDIVRLAQAAGMRSIVFTSKHHDGFCMYGTHTTPYNIVEATPLKRDVMKELADACHEAGMNFGVYFSLIDWHYPPAMPVSSHNADSITPMHHRYNMDQIREILTRYGSVSELWFDMGSMSPAQSREMYALVHRLQPACKVSGRLGNDYCDFSVMADNKLPEHQLDLPWQAAASIFSETWGYRSWQKRGNPEDKIREKLHDLVTVVARGGNYLLNIGPKGDGSVVPFEKQVLEGMGSWIKKYEFAIYGTEANPYNKVFDWGEITRHGNKIYLFVRPQSMGATITLPPLTSRPLQARLLTTPGSKNIDIHIAPRGDMELHLPTTPDSRAPWDIVEVSFESTPTPLSPVIHSAPDFTTAQKSYAYSCWDYYTGHNTITSLSWTVNQRPTDLLYTQEEIGRKIKLNINGTDQILQLRASQAREVTIPQAEYTRLAFGTPYGKLIGDIFGAIPDRVFKVNKVSELDKATKLDTLSGSLPVGILAGYLYAQDIQAPHDMVLPVEVTYGNGVYVMLNGELMTSYLTRDIAQPNKRMILLPLRAGHNRLAVKFYNRFAQNLIWGIAFTPHYTTYSIPLRASSHIKAPYRIQLDWADDHRPASEIHGTNIRFTAY
ncbi:alpha-L-fucosidase [Porphyromonas pogonae]|uniref:alpha-L-fucosidase n=1 Tax=Porphyromonas pogonae TaxID=867595 RepID=UPI002E7A0CF5|nr:alpha-L-fucosidase [Porphyromonas pogonae]